MNTMLDKSPLPNRHAIRTLIESLIGRDVDLKDCDPVPPKTTNVIAVYVTDKITVAAIVVVDLEGAARLGGALGMLPKGGVEDIIAERDLTGMVRDNAYEVLNVLAAAFNVENAPHVRLYEMYGPNGSVPGDVMSLSQVIGSRLDIKATIAGYGDARVSIITR
ncbi:MAG TPA: hypothetical protein VHN80_06480 [Kineosporiaceae bacterium]|jgi:hypothetical protein|nr:hypothetical protein [Kineosporiaceae bacterium]